MYKKGPDEIAEWTPYQQVVMADLEGELDRYVYFADMEEFLKRG